MDSRKNFNPILAASISGGRFPHQLAFARRLSRSKFNPSLCMGSSGGCFVIYLCEASDWSEAGINRIAGNLSGSILFESWYPNIKNWFGRASIVMEYYKGSMYKQSEKASQMFDDYFSKPSIQKTEIWAAAINRDTGALGLFCNKSMKDSIIKGNHLNRRIYKAEVPLWLEGNIDEIKSVITASSSVPVILSPVDIRGHQYVDSGVKFASPLAPLKEEIIHIAKKNGDRLHIIYFSGYNIEADIPVSTALNMYGQGIMAANNVVRALVLHDRASALDLIRQLGGGSLNYIDVNHSGITQVYEKLWMTDACFFEMYPTVDDELDYTEFESKDVINMMMKTEESMAGRLWWVGKADIFFDIEGTIAEIFIK